MCVGARTTCGYGLLWSLLVFTVDGVDRDLDEFLVDDDCVLFSKVRLFFFGLTSFFMGVHWFGETSVQGVFLYRQYGGYLGVFS